MLSSKTETISVSLPSWLVEVLEETCRVQDFTKSCLIKRALKRYLLDKNQSPELWEALYGQTMKG